MLIHAPHTGESFLMTPDQITPEAAAMFYPLIAEGEHRFPWFAEDDEECQSMRITVEFDFDGDGKCRGAFGFLTRDGAAIAMFGVALNRDSAGRVWTDIHNVYSQLCTTKQGLDRQWVQEPKQPTETPWAVGFPIFDEMPDECWRSDITRGWAWAFQDVAETGALDRVGCEGWGTN